MTTNDIVGQILLRVSGGIPTSDNSVREWDVRSYLPAAVNYAITQDYWANLQRDGDHEVPGSFLSEYSDLTVSTDNKGREYITLPVKKINIGNNRGIRYVTDNCGNTYKPMPQGQVALGCYWGKVLGNIRYYQERGQNIYITNKPPMVESLNVGAVTDVSSLGEDDELPIPAGYEPQVIDILAAFFTDARFTPKDYIIDGRDLFSRGA